MTTPLSLVHAPRLAWSTSMYRLAPLRTHVRTKATSAVPRKKAKAKAKAPPATSTATGVRPPDARPIRPAADAAAATPKVPSSGQPGSTSSASASAGSSQLPPLPGARPIVIFRAPPGMKRWLYYFIGCVFTGASAYQGYILSQHMAWPWFSRDYENNPPKLVSAWTRYPVGALVFGTGGMLGFFMFWSPSRLVTRITLYPATSQVGVRTCAPPFRALLPRALQNKQANVAPLSAHDSRERLHDFAALMRRDNTSAAEIADFALGKGRRVVRGDGKGYKKVPSSLLLGEGSSLGYQLEAAPHPKSPDEVKNLYKLGWARFKLWMKGSTDWSVPQGVPGLTPAESKAKAAMHAKEPWFLDRHNFDRLFPVRQ
ncbi:uncharacterized protein PFL1_03966 [Pseudozyma flocculosa PF-1]|uniref:Uncharacterized protein n=2 Tax=Pseudozyma flocculosa TaxID=84751 RepID=A0A5C3EX17_9BASI|nr:uncharacterized protein PFL1_03966 [Pseudozyma flocculosa PF-1]EPQ28663.1 hypothetical protein PFL1_03966 [Pseudozyma flocculosa PF-1]SPO36612.1 uncharacterized protein PSFLO_02083 [Pseudozyma flocculosa]